ncbi:MAG: cysteine desulfurase [Spirochaetia bacterium]|nr:cysteine desulfurase [Spirochaetia bacterium]NCC90524.1 cysteine desulfurase [Spirochaetia bacterium]
MACMYELRYFDNAATTVMSESSLRTYQEVASAYIGNPSALHQKGLEAKAYLQQNRARVASLLQIGEGQLIFTSGATEANAIVLESLIWRQQKGHVILSAIEHPSVSEFARLLKHLGWSVSFLNAPGGFIRCEDLQKALTKQTRLVSLMLVNNVVGSIQDIRSLVRTVREFEKQAGGRHIHFHTDATQALGKIRFSLSELGVDSAAFSAHKFHGPRGVGMLYNANPALENLSRAGDQEGGLRGGTENLAGIAAMTTALEEAYASLDRNLGQVGEINAYLRERLGSFTILSPSQSCSPYILNLSVKPLPSEVFTRMLYDRGFCVSSGSACSNNAKQKGEGVLTAMHYHNELAKSSLRLSFSNDTTLSDAEALADAIISLYQEHA